ncbi:hypothetical protein V1514DRAFT_341832 [Lipomyces japonicus]|uniref:uncharacterized protein n=1 Tax=Lipomyces japonicus TaxID=56871 RepID=UPI0034CD2517
MFARKGQLTCFSVIIAFFLIAMAALSLTFGFSLLETENFESFVESDHGGFFVCDDPYKRNGYLYLPKNYHYLSWIPFYDDFFNSDDPLGAVYPHDTKQRVDIASKRLESQFLADAPHMWMSDLVEYVELKNIQDISPQNQTKLRHAEKRISFLNGKRVLMIADSVDRYILQYFCSELGLEADFGNKRHTIANCFVPQLNFTIYHWHLASYFSYRPSWWWQKTMDKVAFEERYETIFKPTLSKVEGATGKPDVILFQSGLWDQVSFLKMADAELASNKKLQAELKTINRQMTWSEIRLYSSRWKQFIHHIRGIFGDDVHLVYRSLTPHKESDDRDLMIYDMDRIGRYFSNKMGIEVFEWARLVTGFSSMWRDQVHISQGPLSWLYQNMLLSLVFRAAGGVEVQGNITRWPSEFQQRHHGIDPWFECHQNYVQNILR